MGTVVFPDALLKVFVTASAEERARRRYKQLIAKGISVTMESLLRDIRERDARDAGRAAAPLKPAADAVILDTTELTIDAAIARVLGAVPGAATENRPQAEAAVEHALSRLRERHANLGAAVPVQTAAVKQRSERPRTAHFSRCIDKRIDPPARRVREKGFSWPAALHIEGTNPHGYCH